MSSRFVSAGQINPSSGQAVPASPPNPSSTSTSTPPAQTQPPTARSAEWAAVQRDLEAERARREAAQAEQQQQQQQQSLYDVLQANRAAKQAAFEEAHRLRNQFRALDEDEIDFLDEVRARARAEEQRRRAEEDEGLRAFREARREGGGGEAGPEAEAEGEVDEGRPVGEGAEAEAGAEEWAVGRKRKRAGKEGLKGVKRRGSSGAVVAGSRACDGHGAGAEAKAAEGKGKKDVKVQLEPKKTVPAAVEQTKAKPKPKLGLVDYGSDEDDD